MKLWSEKNNTETWVFEHTTTDRVFDEKMAPLDIIGSIAHLTMLRKCNYVRAQEFEVMKSELIKLYHESLEEKFHIPEDSEDIHSFVEWCLTSKLGNIGKKLHTARSRNDQVLLDIKLYIRNEIEEILKQIDDLFSKLMELSRKYEYTFMPGYTHGQIAMPSSFGLWFSAYAEQLAEDIIEFYAAFQLANMNPLGSGSGYGSTFNIDREITTSLLGFDSMHFNVVGAQLSRGKTEILMANALALMAATLSRFSNDCCLFSSQNFDFISLSEDITTGSSIMPHKKNPDVFELLRANLNRLKSLPNEIFMYTSNLTTGYSRDFQLTKQSLFPAIDILKASLQTLTKALAHIRINESLMKDSRYREVFSVNRIKQYTEEGMPFREAYHRVSEEIKQGQYAPDYKMTSTTIGNIGNICFDGIENKYEHYRKQFPFQKIRKALQELVEA